MARRAACSASVDRLNGACGRRGTGHGHVTCVMGEERSRLDAVEGGDERLGRNGDAHPRARQPPRLGEGLRDDEVRRAADERDARRGGLFVVDGRKVDVGLVDDDERPCRRGGEEGGLWHGCDGQSAAAERG